MCRIVLAVQAWARRSVDDLEVAEGVGEQEEPDQAEQPEEALSGGASETLAQLPEHGVGSLPEGYVAGQQGQWGSTKIRL
jgi:hypothetical protein